MATTTALASVSRRGLFQLNSSCLVRRVDSELRILKQTASMAVSATVRAFSSSSTQAPLTVVWKPLDASITSSGWNRPPLLIPFSQKNARDRLHEVSSIDEALETIHTHYSNEHFVGGMGESDLGVALAAPSASSDVLDFPEPLIELMQLVKQERHGVPFHLCTTGIATASSVDWELWNQAPLETWQVSLYAASPPEYAKLTAGGSAPAFGKVCQFLIEATEHGQAVEALVLPSQAAAGRDLALSLGAQQVHVTEEKL